MYDGGKIILGLVVFVALFTFPFWYTAASGSTGSLPDLDLPDPAAGNCVMDVEWMRDSHMELLNTWRDEVVREGNRMFKTADGRQFEKSLTKTCISCHTDKAAFCDRCHNYVDVRPYCWDCHVDSLGN